MAQLSLSECKWRMVRRVLKKRQFTYADARNGTRFDQEHFDWLVAEGFFVAVDDGYQLTDKARAAADLGLYEYEPSRRPAAAAPAPAAPRPRRSKSS